MRYLIVIFLLVFVFNTNAQQLTGQIVDSDGIGVANAHVFYPEILKGTMTDSLGNFNLKQIPQFKNILVSCIGFCDTIILIDNFSDSNIQLRRREYIIKEVPVIVDKKEKLIIGSKKKKPNGVNFIVNGVKKGNNRRDEFTKVSNSANTFFFYFPGNSNAKVKSVGLHIRKINNPNIKMDCRILAPDTTHTTLGMDLLQIEKSISLNKGWNFIDLNNENIRFPDNGLILVFNFNCLEGNYNINISGSPSEEYSWMSSLNYKKDFGIINKSKSHKPAVRMLILD